MDFLELVRQRFSVRGYLDTPVEEGKILYILEAALYAPSACNNQPWIFIVIRERFSREGLEKIYDRPWFLQAPVIIAACCDRSISWRRRDGKDYGDIDIAVAFDHLTLAATEQGLGTCWIGNFNVAAARSVLMLPDSIDPIAFTPLGYPSPDKPRKTRKTIDETVHWEFFGGKKS
jgi:nitroreductase